MGQVSEKTKRIFTVLAVLCLALFGTAAVFREADVPGKLTALTVRAEDKALEIGWEAGEAEKNSRVRIVISDGGEVRKAFSVRADSSPVTFRKGEHGIKYTVSASLESGFPRRRGPVTEKEILFLDYDRVYELPTLIIDTVSGQDPSYRVREKPSEELMGVAITDNFYLSGSVTAVQGAEKLTTRCKIRIRGNTSAAQIGENWKKPYRLELTEALDLLGLGEEYAGKNWALLLGGNDLNTFLGEAAAEYCGVEFRTHGTFVNLILNGDYKGCFFLNETVEPDTADGLLGETGAVFESDPYFWAEDVFFRPERMSGLFGITVKYPRSAEPEGETFRLLAERIQEAEDSLALGDPAVYGQIDVPSCARWLLAHEYLGGTDVGGSNRYFYMDNVETGKIRMGPLWDFDDVFSGGDAFYHVIEDGGLPFRWLLQDGVFLREYCELSSRLTEGLPAHFAGLLEELETAQGRALDESWQLDAARWEVSCPTFRERKEEALAWFEDRSEWLLFRVTEPVWLENGLADYTFCDELCFALDSCEPLWEEGSYKISGWAFSEKAMEHSRVILLGREGDYRAAYMFSRPDVQEHFGLSDDWTGFSAVVQGGAWELCVLDTESRTIYRSRITVPE